MIDNDDVYLTLTLLHFYIVIRNCTYKLQTSVSIVWESENKIMHDINNKNVIKDAHTLY